MKEVFQVAGEIFAEAVLLVWSFIVYISELLLKLYRYSEPFLIELKESIIIFFDTVTDLLPWYLEIPLFILSLFLLVLGYMVSLFAMNKIVVMLKPKYKGETKKSLKSINTPKF